MKTMSRLRLIIVTFFMCLSMSVFAQANADKLFNEGQKLMEKGTRQSYALAIKKFKAAKALYATDAKKKLCDDQIRLCKPSPASSSSKVKAKVETPEPAPAPAFAVSKKRIDFEGDKAGSLNIAVTAPSLDWQLNIPTGIAGEENFVKANRSNDAKSVDILVDPNPTTINRQQTINVSLGSQKETITVVQSGKTVRLSSSENLIEVGLKGGKKSLEIYTNSDSTITSNNNLTWYIESKPGWVELTSEVQKKKGFLNKALNSINSIVSSTSVDAGAADTKTSDVKVIINKVEKSDPAYLSGRSGEIVIASQDKKIRIMVQQK